MKEHKSRLQALLQEKSVPYLQSQGLFSFKKYRRNDKEYYANLNSISGKKKVVFKMMSLVGLIIFFLNLLYLEMHSTGRLSETECF